MHIADTFGPGQHSGVIAVYSHESKSEYKHNQPGRLERVLTLGGYMIVTKTHSAKKEFSKCIPQYFPFSFQKIYSHSLQKMAGKVKDMFGSSSVVQALLCVRQS